MHFAIKKTYLNDFSVTTSRVIAILIILKGSVDWSSQILRAGWSPLKEKYQHLKLKEKIDYACY